MLDHPEANRVLGIEAVGTTILAYHILKICDGMGLWIIGMALDIFVCRSIYGKHVSE